MVIVKIGAFVAALLCVFFATLALSEHLTEEMFIRSTGTTYPELSSMKEECEHSLPRNQHCFASIIFIPTASEE